MKRMITLLIALMFVSISVPLHGALLLDNGCNLSSYSVSLISGSESRPGGSTGFQPFTIDNPGWQISSIGVFGYEWNGNISGMTGTIRPDIGGRPDENSSLGELFYSLPLWGDRDWADAQIDMMLPQGRYWIEFNAASSESVSSLYPGLQGEDRFLRRKDGEEFIRNAFALRINGSIVPEPCSLVLLGLGGLALRKRNVVVKLL